MFLGTMCKSHNLLMQPTELSTTNYEHTSMVEQNKLKKTKHVNPPIIRVKNVSSRYGPPFFHQSCV
jgi:hypothetical protein